MRWGRETPRRSAARCVVNCWFSGIRTIARPNCMLRTMSLSSLKTAPGSSSRSPSAPTRAGEPAWSMRLSSRICTSSDSGNATGSCSMVTRPQHQPYHANEINETQSKYSKGSPRRLALLLIKLLHHKEGFLLLTAQRDESLAVEQVLNLRQRAARAAEIHQDPGRRAAQEGDAIEHLRRVLKHVLLVFL